MRTRTFGAVLLAVWLGVVMSAAAATTQEEVDEAKRAQDLWAARQAAAEARQAVAEADAAAAKAKLGTLELSKFSKPEVEAKTLNVEVKILSYHAVERIATAIAGDVAPRVASPGASAASAVANTPTAVVLVNDTTLNAVQQVRSFKNGATVLTKAVAALRVPELAADNAQCAQPAVGGAGLGVLGGIDVALQIAQIFKVDRNLEGTDVTVDDFALATGVMGRLKAAKVDNVILASAYLPGGLDDSAPPSELAKRLDELTDAQVTLDIRVADIARRRDKLLAREADTVVKLPPACKEAFDDARRTYTALEARAKSLKERADAFLAAVTATDEKAGAPVLQSMLQAEALAATFKGAYLLHLKPIAGGGTTYTKKNLLWSSVGIGGGAIVAYALTGGPAGALVTSGTVTEYGGFVKPEDLAGHIAAQRAAQGR